MKGEKTQTYVGRDGTDVVWQFAPRYLHSTVSFLSMTDLESVARPQAVPKEGLEVVHFSTIKAWRCR